MNNGIQLTLIKWITWTTGAYRYNYADRGSIKHSLFVWTAAHPWIIAENSAAIYPPSIIKSQDCNAVVKTKLLLIRCKFSQILQLNKVKVTWRKACHQIHNIAIIRLSNRVIVAEENNHWLACITVTKSDTSCAVMPAFGIPVRSLIPFTGHLKLYLNKKSKSF